MLDLFLFIGYKTFQRMNGSLAQLEEHLVYTERVGSSNLSTPTNQEALLLEQGFCFIYEEEVRTPELFNSRQSKNSAGRSTFFAYV